jgi:hypothetical protein
MNQTATAAPQQQQQLQEHQPFQVAPQHQHHSHLVDN